MVCGCSTQQHSKDSGCRLDNEPGSREFPTSFEGRGTSLDAIQDTASKCQRINIPFTHRVLQVGILKYLIDDIEGLRRTIDGEVDGEAVARGWNQIGVESSGGAGVERTPICEGETESC